MYITGGIGATHLGEAFSFPYDLPNDTAYAETCASIGLMFWARRMLEIVPDAKYADIMAEKEKEEKENAERLEAFKKSMSKE